MEKDEIEEVELCKEPTCETEKEHSHCTECGVFLYPPWIFNRNDELVCRNCKDKEDVMKLEIQKSIDR